MKFAAVFALLMLVCSACASSESTEYAGDPTEHAIAAYEERHGELTDACRDHALNVDVEYAPVIAVQHECKCVSCGGCMDRFDAQGAHVWLMDDAPAYMVAHETMHVILACMRPSSDGDSRHLSTVWQDGRIKGR